MENIPTDQSHLLKCLQGQQIRIPNLPSLFPAWSETINEHRDILTPTLNDYIDSLFPNNPLKADKAKRTDLALLTCLWWPKAGFKELCTLSFLTVWLLMWDDEIDQASSSFSDDLAAAKRFREYTLQFVRGSIGLDETKDLDLDVPGSHFVQRFAPIGDFIRGKYDAAHKQAFIYQMEYTARMSEEEQVKRVGGTLPTVKEYWTYRLGTNLMGVICAATELGFQTHLPISVLQHPLMKELSYITNVIVALTNDILSLKKEINKGEVCSLIPLLVGTGQSVQDALDSTVTILTEAIDQLTRLDKEILGQLKSDAIDDVVQACSSYCTGFVCWSLSTPRYGIASCTKDEDGSIVLGL